MPLQMGGEGSMNQRPMPPPRNGCGDSQAVSLYNTVGGFSGLLTGPRPATIYCHHFTADGIPAVGRFCRCNRHCHPTLEGRGIEDLPS